MSESLPAEQWDVIGGFEMFNDVLRNNYSLPFAVSDACGVPGPFSAAVREQRLHDMCLVEAVMSPHRGVRTSREVGATPRDIVGLQYVLSGHEIIYQGDDVWRLGAGDVMVFDSEIMGSYEITHTVRKQTVILPRALAEAVLPGVHTPAKVRVIAGGSDISVRALFGVLRTLGDTLTHLSPEATTKASALVVQMLADLDLGNQRIRQILGRRGVDELCARVLAYVEDNLGDRALSPTSVAAAHFMSVRALYQGLEQLDMPLAAHIRTRRLARCYADLIAGDDPIGEVAARWGFVNLPHFSRAFARHYGFPPSQLRRSS